MIPVLDEAERIGALIDRLSGGGFDEVVVVDGGSSDETRTIVAERRGVALVEAQRGRGPQLDAGARATTAGALLTGIVKHLPDPPLPRPNWDSDKVNLSDEAFSYGMPDGPLTVAAHAFNLALAAAGPSDRWRTRPWLPWLATALAGVQTAVAAQYLFYTQPVKEKAWCPWCVLDALSIFATFGLTLPETVKAARHAGGRG